MSQSSRPLLRNEPIFTVEATLEGTVTLGHTPCGERRFAGIAGRTVKERKPNGRILPAGGLHQSVT